MTASPWQAALGDRFDELDPGLRAYFSPLASGERGVGRGVFEVVGTPRRWLWPVIAVLGALRIVWPVWQRDVPFEVVNRMTDGALRATRTFHLARGPRTMTDAITAHPPGIVDRIGRGGRIEVRFRAEVAEGALVLTSTRTALRLGRARIRIPRPLAPRTRIEERALPGGRQRVAFTLDAPVIGRVYEYAGDFRYEVENG